MQWFIFQNWHTSETPEKVCALDICLLFFHDSHFLFESFSAKIDVSLESDKNSLNLEGIFVRDPKGYTYLFKSTLGPKGNIFSMIAIISNSISQLGHQGDNSSNVILTQISSIVLEDVQLSTNNF
ncbi:hypothetical protein WA026_018798 [Henosepilachna vigintioctopunctata]|uniref:Uncharacterized protein n=1 Tax=Henosepilachna vigintioctopunctata TaxID=420089 RepID=A0AAW1TWB5_9CUCU